MPKLGLGAQPAAFVNHRMAANDAAPANLKCICPGRRRWESKLTIGTNFRTIADSNTGMDDRKRADF